MMSHERHSELIRMALSHLLWEDDVARREKAIAEKEEELTKREERLAKREEFCEMEANHLHELNREIQKREEELYEKERRAEEGETHEEEEHHEEEEEHHEEEETRHEEEETRHEEEETRHKEHPRPKRQQKKRIFCQYLLEIDPSKKFYNTFRNKWVKIVEKAEECGGEFLEKVKALDLISIRSIPEMKNELYKLGLIEITNEVMDAVAYLTKITQSN